MKVSDEILLKYYYMGIELEKENKDFPIWFEFAEEKYACLKGYTDSKTENILHIEEEILKEIKRKIQ